MFSASWTVIQMVLNILLFFMRKEAKMTMAVIYATLIVKGKKTFAQVPDLLKPQVKQILIDLEVPELAE